MKRYIIHEYDILAARSSRNKRKDTSRRQIADRIVRCKSSNVWGYVFDVDEYDGVGTLYIQFKNLRGGPGDIYRYYEVPARVYRRFISGPSRGHSFWKLIRNKYKYSKLTGDKIGKLPNAVNY